MSSDSSVRRHAEKLRDSIGRHDIDALVDCFSPEYHNETPVHPARSFTGTEQVRRNWTQIFAAVPDIRATLVRTTEAPEEVWAEWEFSGTRRDGAPHVMRGVTIMGVDGERATWARFYMEPIDHDTMNADDAVRQVVGANDAGR